MARTNGELMPEGASQHKRLSKVSRRYLKTERRHLILLVLIGWSVLALGSFYFWFEYLDLGVTPPKTSIHDQTANEQVNKILSSQLGQSGGFILNGQQENTTEQKFQAQEKRTALDYLSVSRDLDAQEGVWRASRVIAVIGFLQTIIGLGGLLLIYGTLKATQDTFREVRKTTHQATLATAAADRSARVAERAELPFVHFTVKAQYVGGKKGTTEGPFEEIQVRPVLRNYGASPAMDVHYDVRVSGQDEVTYTNSARGSNGQHGSCEAISAGETLDIGPLLPFPQSFYYECSERHYIVSCFYGYSDIKGNVLVDREAVHYLIWPQMPGEAGDLYDIGVNKMTDEQVARAKERANEFDRLLRESGENPRL